MVYCTPITTGSSSALSTAERRTQQKAVAYTSANRLKCRKKINKYISITLSHHIVSLFQRSLHLFKSISNRFRVYFALYTLKEIRLSDNIIFCNLYVYDSEKSPSNVKWSKPLAPSYNIQKNKNFLD